MAAELTTMCAEPSGVSAAASPSLSRAELGTVIRRAAELQLSALDQDVELSEEEVLRIGAELGLAPRHVRQALLELPSDPVPEGALSRWVERWYGPSCVLAVRAVETDRQEALARMEQYLVSQELLQPRRRHGPTAWYSPADDWVSDVVRTFKRPAGRFHLARARRVALSVHPLEPAWSHVRLEVDLRNRRRRAVQGGAVFGSLFGGTAGVLAGGVVALTTFPIAGVAAGLLVAGGAAAAVVAGTAQRYRSRSDAVLNEVEGILDRLERGERLEPPPAPWRESLRQRLLGRHSFWTAREG